MMDMIVSLLSWWLAIQLVSFVAMPVTLFLFRSFPVQGYAFNKSLSLLLVAYISWVLAIFDFGSFNKHTWVLALILVGYIGCWINTRNGGEPQKLFFKKYLKQIMVYELLFIFFLVIGLLIRGYGAVSMRVLGTEKLMDLSFLSSLVESPGYPPQDPWLAGYAINYYYLGYVFIALLTVISGVSTGTAFNLGLVTIFSLTAISVIGLLDAMVHAIQGIHTGNRTAVKYLAGFLGVVMVLLIGNQAGAFQVIFNSAEIITLDDRQMMRAIVQIINHEEGIKVEPAIKTHDSDFGLIEEIRPVQSSFSWWWPSRAVWDSQGGTQEVIQKGYAITEFPFFSFYLGDLHPHVLALPFALLCLALSFELFISGKVFVLPGNKIQLLKFSLICLILGSMYMINTWDTPTYAAIYFGAVVFSYRSRIQERFDFSMLKKIAVILFFLILGCLLVDIPFLITFKSFAGGAVPEILSGIPVINKIAGMVSFAYAHTTWYAFFSIFGLFVIILFSYFSMKNVDNDKPHAFMGMMDWIMVIVAAIVGTLLHFPLFALVPLMAILIRKAWQENQAVHSFVLFAMAVALFVILLADMIYIRDPFDNRMNTVFKFYNQAWMILSIMAAFALSLFILNIRKNEVQKFIALLVVLILFIGACVYPVATFTYGVPWAAPNWNLDGVSYLSEYYPDETAAIAWISANTEAEDIILTSVGSSYEDESGRIAAVTGRATLLGWAGSHEYLWRSGSADMMKAVIERERDVPYIYQSTNVEEAVQLLMQYDVDYIYIGPRERRLYTGRGLEKFVSMFPNVFSAGEVQIYQVK